MPLWGVDYSDARPDPAWMRSVGVGFVYRYLGPPYWAKSIQKPELAALRAAGLPVVFGYEETGSELLGGYAAGVRVAKIADAYLNALGLSGYPIILNADIDVQEWQQLAINAACQGAASVLGHDRTWLYGGYYTVSRAFDAGVISGAMQTDAWSQGRWDPRAQIQQYMNGQWGDTVDFDRAMTDYYGQSPVDDQDGMDMWSTTDSANLAQIAMATAKDMAPASTGVYVNTDTGEYCLSNVEIGKGLSRYTGTAGAPYSVVDSDPRITVYKGFMVTSDPDVSAAWARAYSNGVGGETARVNRAAYIQIQQAVSGMADHVYPATAQSQGSKPPETA